MIFSKCIEANHKSEGTRPKFMKRLLNQQKFCLKVYSSTIVDGGINIQSSGTKIDDIQSLKNGCMPGDKRM